MSFDCDTNYLGLGKLLLSQSSDLLFVGGLGWIVNIKLTKMTHSIIESSINDFDLWT